MRLGTSSPLAHATPEDWAKKQKELGLSAINFHLTCEDDAKLIDEYVKAARENDLMLAEVGVWRNTMDPDEASRKEESVMQSDSWSWQTTLARGAA